MISGEDRLLGWQLDQYLAAYVWVQSQGEKRVESLENSSGDMEFFNELQELWGEAHHCPPLTGAYKLYDPEIPGYVDLCLRVRWMNVRAEGAFVDRVVNCGRMFS